MDLEIAAGLLPSVLSIIVVIFSRHTTRMSGTGLLLTWWIVVYLLGVYSADRVGFDTVFYGEFFGGEHEYLSGTPFTLWWFSTLAVVFDNNSQLVKAALSGVNVAFIAYFLRGQSLFTSALFYILLVPFLLGNYKLALALPAMLIFTLTMSRAARLGELCRATMYASVAVAVHLQNILLLIGLAFSPLMRRPRSVIAMSLVAVVVFAILLRTPVPSYAFDYVVAHAARYLEGSDYEAMPILQKLVEFILNAWIIVALVKLRVLSKRSSPFSADIDGAVFYHMARMGALVLFSSAHVQGRLLLVFVVFELIAYRRCADIIKSSNTVRKMISSYVAVRGAGALFGSLQSAIF